MHLCPVCKSRTNPNKAHIKIQYKHDIYYPCCPLCQAVFEKEPEKYIKNLTGHKN